MVKKKNKSCLFLSYEIIYFCKHIADRFCILNSSNLPYSECFLEKLHLHFGEGNLKLHYVEKTCSFFSFNPNKSSFDELKHFSN